MTWSVDPVLDVPAPGDPLAALSGFDRAQLAGDYERAADAFDALPWEMTTWLLKVHDPATCGYENCHPVGCELRTWWVGIHKIDPVLAESLPLAISAQAKLACKAGECWTIVDVREVIVTTLRLKARQLRALADEAMNIQTIVEGES